MSYSIIGQQILKYRKEKGLTQRELGEAIGVSSSAVSQWESGGTPDISLLPALSDILGVTVDALFGRTDTRREDLEETVRKYIASLPDTLTMLVTLYRQAPRHRTVGVLAKLAGVAQNEAEEILQKFTERKLAESLTLDTEDGETVAYAVNMNGAVLPLLAAARLAVMETEGIRIITDKRSHGKGEK